MYRRSHAGPSLQNRPQNTKERKGAWRGDGEFGAQNLDTRAKSFKVVITNSTVCTRNIYQMHKRHSTIDQMENL
ncbi:hypothetical protein LIER_01564 [Lithospermum erythrorhizon]|uniref:Uncharacterized protein n=1 Tax=Lithospermum erythrorhizon TaxID=34254 RepID=A0AAV3NMI8_LITER